MAALGEERTAPKSSTAATTVAIDFDKGWARRPNATIPRNAIGTTVEAKSQAAEAATTAHTKESAGLMDRRCQIPKLVSRGSWEKRFRDLVRYRTPERQESECEIATDSLPAYVAHLDSGKIDGSAATQLRVSVVTPGP